MFEYSKFEKHFQIIYKFVHLLCFEGSGPMANGHLP